MTTTYDPADPSYRDEADLRLEMERVFDLCHGCRLCFNLCPAFPSLFELIDENDGQASALTAAEQDHIVDECYQCKLCYVKCPYVPPHEWALDFPRLMMRAHATRKAKDKTSPREWATDQFLGRTDLLGKVSTLGAPLVNSMTSKPGSLARRAMEVTVGIHRQRLLPPYSRQRFSSWFKKRRRQPMEAPRAEVSVFPTCFVEYMEPEIGMDTVGVYEKNNIACSIPTGTRCCGAPWLHAGEIDQFTRQARRNVAALANEVRAGKDVVIAQPTCGYVIRRDYPIYVPGPDADLVASHSYDVCEYLMNLHRAPDGGLETEFEGAVPEAIAYHLSCHFRAQNIGYRGRDLLQLTGARVTVVERCSGIDGTWGYRSENYELARKVAVPLRRELEAVGAETFCGDCHLANTAILEETGTRPLHPIQVVARAYGLEEGS